MTRFLLLTMFFWIINMWAKAKQIKKLVSERRVKAVRNRYLKKKGNELVVNGWDRDYDYTFVKDSVDDKDQKLHVKFSDQENVKLKKPVRKRNLKINSDLANKLL
jgi:hypothetical protein